MSDGLRCKHHKMNLPLIDYAPNGDASMTFRPVEKSRRLCQRLHCAINPKLLYSNGMQRILFDDTNLLLFIIIHTQTNNFSYIDMGGSVCFFVLCVGWFDLVVVWWSH